MSGDWINGAFEVSEHQAKMLPTDPLRRCEYGWRHNVRIEPELAAGRMTRVLLAAARQPIITYDNVCRIYRDIKNILVDGFAEHVDWVFHDSQITVTRSTNRLFCDTVFPHLNKAV